MDRKDKARLKLTLLDHILNSTQHVVEGRGRAHGQAHGLVVTTNAHYAGDSMTFDKGVPQPGPTTSVSESSKAHQTEVGGSDKKTTSPLKAEEGRILLWIKLECLSYCFRMSRRDLREGGSP